MHLASLLAFVGPAVASAGLWQARLMLLRWGCMTAVPWHCSTARVRTGTLLLQADLKQQARARL